MALKISSDYHKKPILGVYYYPKPEWGAAQFSRDLQVFAEAGLTMIWLFFDPFYDQGDMAGLQGLMDAAAQHGLGVVPALGQFLQLRDHPDVKIVNADGSTSDDPRYWNMGCFRNPKLMELATGRATSFFRDFGKHPAIYLLEGKPAMNFVHEAYYRNSVPEFGGGPMHPNCYCPHCLKAFEEYLAKLGLGPTLAAPKDASDAILWQHWLNCHAQAIPEFLSQLIQTTKAQMPVWATHECNDFYPASWQSVYTGNDWWRMAAVLDFGHEDMYPLEFDTRYQCYVYNYAKDILHSALNFKGFITANGQAFNSWLGYQLPENSMSEQIFSCLAHGALGLVWWTELPGIAGQTDYHMVREQEDEAQIKRYRMIRKTEAVNSVYRKWVQKLEGFQRPAAKIALVYSWTTMCQELNDHHTYDTLLTYMLLTQCGFPVDIVSETQVAGGVLQARDYEAVFVLGCGALPLGVHQAVDEYVQMGGWVIADYAMGRVSPFPPAFAQWRDRSGYKPRMYTLPDGKPVAVQVEAGLLTLPDDAEILGKFEDGTPAIGRIQQGKGSVILLGSSLGWDYSNYPGYYDLTAMFPSLIRRDDVLRCFVYDLLVENGITPPVRSSHADVETAIWHRPEQDAYVVIAINHLQEQVETTIRLPVMGENWQIEEKPTGLRDWSMEDGQVVLRLSLAPLEGCAWEVIGS